MSFQNHNVKCLILLRRYPSSQEIYELEKIRCDIEEKYGDKISLNYFGKLGESEEIFYVTVHYMDYDDLDLIKNQEKEIIKLLGVRWKL